MRLRVERNSLPPGASRAASVARKAAGSGTCSITSSAVMTGNRAPSASRSSADTGAVGERQVLPLRVGARRLDRLRRRRPGPARRSRARASASAATRRHSPHPAAAGGGESEDQPLPAPPSPRARGGGGVGPDPLHDPRHPRRVHPVQRPHRAVRVPPPRRQRVEPCNLCGRNRHAQHGCPCCRRASMTTGNRPLTTGAPCHAS